MTISTISSERLILFSLLPNMVWQYIVMSQSVLWRNWIAVFKVNVTAKFQNINECLSRRYLLIRWTLVWWCIIMSQIVSQKDRLAVLRVKVTAKDNVIKIWLSNISSDLLIPLQLNLVWWHIINSWIVLWKDWLALLLSLIHIWRCRRDVLCRSRWSPYH